VVLERRISASVATRKEYDSWVNFSNPRELLSCGKRQINVVERQFAFPALSTTRDVTITKHVRNPPLPRMPRPVEEDRPG
jgi:hypothetical protein